MYALTFAFVHCIEASTLYWQEIGLQGSLIPTLVDVHVALKPCLQFSMLVRSVDSLTYSCSLLFVALIPYFR